VETECLECYTKISFRTQWKSNAVHYSKGSCNLQSLLK